MNLSDAILARFGEETISTLPLEKSGTVEGFIETATDWIWQWSIDKRARRNLESGYAAIVLHPDLVAPKPPAEYILRSDFRGDTSPNLPNKICVADYSLNRVVWRGAECRDLSETIAAIKGFGLEKRPFIVFDTEAERIFIYECGAAGPVMRLKVQHSSDMPSGWEDFEAILHELWLEELRYPKDHPNLWIAPDKFYPCREPEKSIQGIICLALKNRFLDLRGKSRGIVIYKEFDLNTGRSDIAAKDHVGRCYFAGEIKVVKSFRFSAGQKKPKKTTANGEQKWAHSGIKQASDYRDVMKAEYAVLLVYDMRSPKTELRFLTKDCRARDVLCRQYPLYGSKGDAGEHAKLPLVIN